MNRRTGKHWSHGITDDMPVKEHRLQKAPACIGNPGAGVLRGNSAGGGQVWKECRPWILSFPGLNLGSVCCGCVILGKLSDCSVPPQETLYSLQVREASTASARVRPLRISRLELLLLFQGLQTGSLCSSMLPDQTSPRLGSKLPL